LPITGGARCHALFADPQPPRIGSPRCAHLLHISRQGLLRGGGGGGGLLGGAAVVLAQRQQWR